MTTISRGNHGPRLIYFSNSNLQCSGLARVLGIHLNELPPESDMVSDAANSDSNLEDGEIKEDEVAAPAPAPTPRYK
jgi:hypothetical protein